MGWPYLLVEPMTVEVDVFLNAERGSASVAKIYAYWLGGVTISVG